MLPKVLAAGAMLWCIGYLAVYLRITAAQDGSAASWYVLLVVVSASSSGSAALGWWPRAALTIGLVTSTVAALVGALSVGTLLIPAAAACAIALLLLGRRPAPGSDADVRGE